MVHGLRRRVSTACSRVQDGRVGLTFSDGATGRRSRLMLPSRLLLVRQNLPDLGLGDAGADARRQLERSNFAARLRPGGRVAIGVGSRGISNIAQIVGSAVQYWRAHG